jgi:hypothetical protein
MRGSVVDIWFDEQSPICSLLRAGKEGQIAIEVLAQLDALRLIDNIFRFIQAGIEVSGLMGQMPSRLGYQPTMGTELVKLRRLLCQRTYN